MVKRILFVCKHNLFRSRVAKGFFDKLNKNKKWVAESAGIIKWDRDDLEDSRGYKVEKKISKEYGIKLDGNSKGLSSSLLKKTEIIVIVADDVHPSIFKKDRSFNGKLVIWKIPDVREKDKKKERVAHKTIRYIENKIKKLVGSLK